MAPLAVLVVVACCVLLSEWRVRGGSEEEEEEEEEDLHQCYVYNGERALYHGSVSSTIDGHTCMSWRSKEIRREWVALGRRDRDLQKNHCRDADGSGYPWCFYYSTRPIPQKCPISHCGPGGVSSLGECYVVNSITGAALYEGNVSRTTSGRTCQQWDAHRPTPYISVGRKDYEVALIGTTGYMSNYCRDPERYGHPWCLTTDRSVADEKCDIPYCPSSELRPGVLDLRQCYITTSQDGRSAVYAGNVSTTVSGLKCQAWSDSSPHKRRFSLDLVQVYDVEYEKNLCRDFDSMGQPWCYTTSPNVRYEVCPVPACDQLDEAWYVNSTLLEALRELENDNATNMVPTFYDWLEEEIVPPLYPESGGGEEVKTQRVTESPFPMTVAISVPSAVVVLCAVLCAMAVYRRRREAQGRAAGKERAPRDSGTSWSVEWLGTTVELFPYSRLRFLQQLGKGNFGTVVKAEALDLLSSGKWDPIAVKTCTDEAFEDRRTEFLREILLMRSLIPHYNIVTYLGASQMPQTGVPVLLLELMPGGDLLSWLRSQRSEKDSADQEMTSSLLVSFACQVARGMAHLEAQKIAHRDVAARNVLLGKHNVCKVSDFGLARRCDESSDTYQSFRGAMPLRWMAPECLRDGVFSSKTDVWSYGVTVWEILTLGATPYSSLGVQEVVSAVQRGQVLEKPASCDEELFQVVSGCWRRQPDQRPSFAGLVASLDELLERDNEYIQLGDFEPNIYLTLETASGTEVV